MTFSPRQLVGAVVVSFCVGALVAPVATREGQAGSMPAAPSEPAFVVFEFMKVEPGKQGDWMKLERDIWKPIHDQRVKEGRILSWSSIAQVIPGDASNGPLAAAVTTFRGWPDPTKDDYERLIRTVHPQLQAGTLFEQAEAARKIVRQEVWLVVAGTTPSGMAR